MYLFHPQSLIAQFLPPHWRNGAKLALIKALSKPLCTLYKLYIQRERIWLSRAHINAQNAVLQSYLNQTYAAEGYNYIELSAQSPGTLSIHIDKRYTQPIDHKSLIEDVKNRIPYGFQVQIIKPNT